MPILKKIRVYLTAFEAEQARNRLLAEGVQAFVEGANAQTALSYVGYAVGGVKLLVAEADVDRAEQILNENTIPQGGAWTCGTCFSEVDAGFEICWNCGGDRSSQFRADG